MQVARRGEEVGAQPVTAEAVGSSAGNRADRDAGRIRADDRIVAPHRIHPCQQRLFGIQALDDGFDDPVRFSDRRQVLVEAAGADQRGEIRGEEGIGLQLTGALQAVARGIARDVQQQDAQAGIGEMRGDLGAHDAGAEHRGLAEHVRH